MEWRGFLKCLVYTKCSSFIHGCRKGVRIFRPLTSQVWSLLKVPCWDSQRIPNVFHCETYNSACSLYFQTTPACILQCVHTVAFKVVGIGRLCLSSLSDICFLALLISNTHIEHLVGYIFVSPPNWSRFTAKNTIWDASKDWFFFLNPSVDIHHPISENYFVIVLFSQFFFFL